VIRRGPSSWSGVGRWDVARGAYEHGAWLRGTLYPQRCDLSPSGEWLCYFALHASATWELGWTYVAISRLPWLHALAAWRTDGTWTRGAHFVPDASVSEVGVPDHGSVDYETLEAGWLAPTPAASYAVERRRGWSEAEGTVPRAADDFWDEHRADSLRLVKPQPGSKGGVRLEVSGRYAAFRSGSPAPVRYRVAEQGCDVSLPDVQWADWAREGTLLVATTGGQLERRTAGLWSRPAQIVADLAQEPPEPVEAPPEARRWH
jgi:hypothetical protein